MNYTEFLCDAGQGVEPAAFALIESGDEEQAARVLALHREDFPHGCKVTMRRRTL